MSEIIIADTTPLIVLSKIGYLELLRNSFQEVTIPEAVYSEIKAGNDTVSKLVEENLSWIHVRQIKNRDLMSGFSSILHAGEVEAIILAEELKANLLLVDDKAARKAASSRGFKITGTLGLILHFKQMGWIPSVEDALALLDQAGFYFSPALKKAILKQAGELKEFQ